MRDTLGRLGVVGLALLMSPALYTLTLERVDVRRGGDSAPGPAAGRLGLALLASAHASDIQDQWRTQQDAHAAHQRGRAALLSGDTAGADAAFTRATELYQRILANNPMRTDLYAQLGDIMIRRGQAQLAYALLTQQIQKGVTDLGVRVQVARALRAMKRSQRALELTQPLRREAPGNLGVAALIGELAADIGDADLAIAELGRALTRPLRESEFPDDVDLPVLRKRLGRLLLDKKRAGEATGQLAEALKVRPGDGEALRWYGEALLDAGQAVQAVQALRRAEAGDIEAQALLGRALADGGKLDEGIALLQKAGDAPAVLHALGLLQARRQPPDLDAAQQALAKAAAAQSVSARYCIDYAALLVRRGQAQQAQAEIDRCAPAEAERRIGPPLTESESQDALAVRVEIASRLGKLDEVVTGLRAVIKGLAGGPGAGSPPVQVQQRLAPLRAQLGRALLKRGLQRLPAVTSPGNPALADLEEARTLQPGSVADHAYALGLLSAGRADEALKLLQPLQQGGAPDPRVLGAYGRALRETGQPAEALAVLERAESLLPTGPGQASAAPAAAAPGASKPPPRPAFKAPLRGKAPARPLPKGAVPAATPATGAPPAPAAPAGLSPEIAALRSALRAEQAITLMVLRRPVDALKRLDAPDELTQRLRAQAYLQAVRSLYETFQAGKAPTAQPGLPAPPLPPGQPVSPPDPQAVLFMTQTALKLGAVVPPVERAEAKLWQVLALVQRGQFEIAYKLAGEIAGLFDLATLDSLLGPGGFAHLHARVTLRGGDFYQGVGYAQQALPLLKPDAARGLHNFMAVAYTQKALELYDRTEVERVTPMLRAAQVQTQGGSPVSIARARYNLAVLSLQRNKLEEARAALQAIDPQLVPEALIGLGIYHELVTDPKSALDAYRRYMQIASAAPQPLPVPVPAQPVVPGAQPAVPVPAAAQVPPALSLPERVRQWIDVLSRVYEGPARITGSLHRTRRSG